MTTPNSSEHDDRSDEWAVDAVLGAANRAAKTAGTVGSAIGSSAPARLMTGLTGD